MKLLLLILVLCTVEPTLSKTMTNIQPKSLPMNKRTPKHRTHTLRSTECGSNEVLTKNYNILNHGDNSGYCADHYAEGHCIGLKSNGALQCPIPTFPNIPSPSCCTTSDSVKIGDESLTIDDCFNICSTIPQQYDNWNDYFIFNDGAKKCYCGHSHEPPDSCLNWQPYGSHTQYKTYKISESCEPVPWNAVEKHAYVTVTGVRDCESQGYISVSKEECADYFTKTGHQADYNDNVAWRYTALGCVELPLGYYVYNNVLEGHNSAGQGCLPSEDYHCDCGGSRTDTNYQYNEVCVCTDPATVVSYTECSLGQVVVNNACVQCDAWEIATPTGCQSCDSGEVPSDNRTVCVDIPSNAVINTEFVLVDSGSCEDHGYTTLDRSGCENYRDTLDTQYARTLETASPSWWGTYTSANGCTIRTQNGELEIFNNDYVFYYTDGGSTRECGRELGGKYECVCRSPPISYTECPVGQTVIDNTCDVCSTDQQCANVFSDKPYCIEKASGNECKARSTCADVVDGHIDYKGPNDVPDEAFSGCSALTTISMPEVTSIGSRAFYGCIELKVPIHLPEATSISDSAGEIDIRNPNDPNDPYSTLGVTYIRIFAPKCIDCTYPNLINEQEFDDINNVILNVYSAEELKTEYKGRGACTN